MNTIRRFYSLKPAGRIQPIPTKSVWSIFTPLAQECKAVNLGQGFPDFQVDEFILKATADALNNNVVQYTRTAGHPRLVNALAEAYEPLFKQKLNPQTNILVTPGATGALFAAIQSYIDPGDEVILIEPFYDSYPLDVKMSGGVPVYVPLKYQGGNSASDWKLDMKDLKKSITKKTKAIIINTPQNIPGKVYTEQELEEIANIAKEHDLLVISDGVYEWMVYDGKKPNYIANIPGMFERTISIGSAGKSFSVTGYKIGWCIGPANFIEEMAKVIQVIPFCVSSPLQEGIAVSFELAKKNNYWNNLKEMMAKKREMLVKTLTNVGLDPIIPEGSYFVLGSTKNVPQSRYFDPSSSLPRDYQFCQWLTKEIGVAAIPPSAFYGEEHKEIGMDFARFAFCKRDDVLQEANKRLSKLKQTM